VILWGACGGGVGEALAGRRQRGKGRTEKREGNPRFAAAATLQEIVVLCMRRLGEEVGLGWHLVGVRVEVVDEWRCGCKSEFGYE
jgi:hypothetical protein